MIKKIKKIVVSIVVLIGTVLNRAYGRALDPAYGIERPEPKFDLLEELFKLAKFFAIPIIAIVGAIVFFKKGKVDTKPKKAILIVILLILIIGAIIFYIYSIYINSNG